MNINPRVFVLPPAFQKTFQNLLIGFILLFFSFVVLKQANPLISNLGRDSGAFLYIASSFLEGGLPYVSVWDSKPPGVFFINAFALWIGGGTRWGVWFVELLFLFMAAWASYYFLFTQFGAAPAVIGILVWMLGLNFALDGGNFTEEYSLVFGFFALLLWSLAWNKKQAYWFYVGIGICAGFSILLRPNNAGVQFSIVAVIFLINVLNQNYHVMWKQIGVIAISALLPLVASGLFFYSKGAFAEFLEAGFLYNFSYAGGKLDILGAFWSGLNSLGFPSGIALIGYFIILKQVWQQVPEKNISPVLLWAVIDGFLEVLISGLSGRNYKHYFICWLPFVAISSAFLMYSVFPSFLALCNKHFLKFSLTVAVFGLLLFPDTIQIYVHSAEHLAFNRSKSVHKKNLLAEYINSRTEPEDLVLVWGGQAGINFLSRRDSPTPYIFYPLYVPSKTTERIASEYYRHIQETPPVLIIDGSYYSSSDTIPLDAKNPLKWTQENAVYANPYLVEVLQYIRENYVLSDVITGVSVYRIKP